MRENSIIGVGYLRKRDSSETKFPSIENAGVYAGRKSNDLCDVPRHKGQAGDFFSINRSPERGIVCLNYRKFSGHLGLLNDSCKPKADFYTPCLRNRDNYFADG